MPDRDINSNGLPAAYRDGFTQFAQTLVELAGDDLLELSAFGGWLINDAFFADTPARSVAVVGRINLKMLDQLASSGARFGKSNVGAPLIMTPGYIRSSCDVFPLELLEIRQLHTHVCGEDHFSELRFEPRDVRLQCERELKSELIQLRQGLLAAAGRHKLLAELCLSVTERTVRVLRGVLYLAAPTAEAKTARDVVTHAAASTEVKLGTLERLLARAREPGMPEFEGLYAEIEALATYADGLADASAGRQ